jgi:hypothetical protein
MAGPPGTGEVELSLVAVSSSSAKIKMRCGGASDSIKLPRTSVVKRRGHGQAEIAQIAEAVGGAFS